MAIEIKITRKQVGDAAEYLIAGLLGLAGTPTTKMLDNQPGFDLIALPTDGRPPQRVSVKCRSQTNAWAAANYRPSDAFDWLAFVYLLKGGDYRCWLIPRDVCDATFTHWDVKGETQMNRYAERGENRIVGGEYDRFENNLTLNLDPPSKPLASSGPPKLPSANPASEE